MFRLELTYPFWLPLIYFGLLWSGLRKKHNSTTWRTTSEVGMIGKLKLQKYLSLPQLRQYYE